MHCIITILVLANITRGMSAKPAGIERKESMQGLLIPCIPKREMNSFNRTIKIPFAVSLTLIFAYSLLLVLVPTSPMVEDALATTPDAELRAESLGDQVITANATQLSDREASETIH